MSRIKKIFFLLFLFRVIFSVSAQSYQGVSIFVPQISGVGSRSEDNSIFFKQLVFELTVQSIKVAQALRDANYSIIGTLIPDKNKQEGQTGADQFIFHMELQDNRTGKIIADGDLIYETPDDLNNLFPSMVNTLLSTIPEMGIEHEWRNKLLYLGGSAFWTPRVYIGDNQSTHFVNFGVGALVEYHFLSFLSAELGLELASDWVAVSANNVVNNRNILLEIPLMIKYVLKLESYFMLEPYIGAHLNIPFYKTTSPPLFSALVGIQYGVKAGSGVIFIDPRFSMDIGKSTVESMPGVKAPVFQRYIMHLGVGYKYGILQKR